MSWSIYITAAKPVAREYVEKATSSYDQEQFARAKAFILAEIEAIADEDAVVVAASGSQTSASETSPRWSQCQIKVEPIRILGMVPKTS